MREPVVATLKLLNQGGSGTRSRIHVGNWEKEHLEEIKYL